MGLAFLSASDQADLVFSRKVSATELLRLHIERVERLNPRLNAVVTLDLERATERAAEADAATARRDRWGPLHGVPITLKDTHATAGIRTTAGYPPLRDYVPAADATVTARLKAAGAILFGKTNTSLLAFDQQTVNPIFGRSNNPWDLSRTTSGSSGGAVAALAAGLTALDLGSDAGGSIRIPAHFCGVYGLKPTFGMVSQEGHIPDLPGMPRLDRVLSTSGPLARSLDDLAIALRLIAGPDGKDTTLPPIRLGEANTVDLRHLRLAWSPTFPAVPVAKEIGQRLEALAARLTQAGARVEQALPPVSFDEQWACFQTISRSTWQLRARLGGIPEVDDGQPEPSLEAVALAMDVRDRITARWEEFFTQWDALLCPPSMTVAYPHCAPGSPIMVDDTAARYDEECRHCYEFNLTGHPALVSPLALTAEGLPIGIQMVSARWADERLLAIANSISPYLPGFSPPAAFA